MRTRPWPPREGSRLALEHDLVSPASFAALPRLVRLAPRGAQAHSLAGRVLERPGLRRWLRNRNITPKIARRGIESSERLGRYRWKVERSISRLFNYRRLTVRYERKSRHFAAFLSLAAILICYKRLTKLTT